MVKTLRSRKAQSQPLPCVPCQGHTMRQPRATPWEIAKQQSKAPTGRKESSLLMTPFQGSAACRSPASDDGNIAASTGRALLISDFRFQICDTRRPVFYRTNARVTLDSRSSVVLPRLINASALLLHGRVGDRLENPLTDPFVHLTEDPIDCWILVLAMASIPVAWHRRSVAAPPICRRVRSRALGIDSFVPPNSFHQALNVTSTTCSDTGMIFSLSKSRKNF